jgi:hypothetical protein
MPAVTRELCEEFLALDKGIRFVGAADKMGRMLAYAYRQGLQSLLTKEESELSATQSILRMGTRKTMEQKLGRTVYAFAMYEKVKRATIPIEDNGILMVSFDIDVDHEPIIIDKIVPRLKAR